MQDQIAVINFAVDKALHDCFLREEVFELLDAAKRNGEELERKLGL